MKFTILLTLLATLNASAIMSQDARLNLSVKDKSLKEVIKLIENQSNFRFFFSDDYLDLNKKVTLTASNKGIEEVLTNLLEDGTVTYKVMENNVIVITPASVQQTKVTGVIIDATTNEPLPGVNVIVKGTTRGITTDIDGKFSIEVSKGETLIFSYIGYVSQEAVVSELTDLRISLAADVKQLDEIVVVGYGTMKKKDLTGSVSSVKADEIESNKSPNVLQVMQGRVSGLDITQSSGEAGGSTYINLRGNRSINASNSPLIMVDGVEYGSTLDINPSDIESIDVLKDAASTAIYGTKGANGVILITTKKGGNGKTNITFNSYVSFNSPSYIPKVMNSQQFLNKLWETKLADREYDLYNATGMLTSYNKSTGVVAWDRTAYPDPSSVFGSYTMANLLADNGKTEANKYEILSTVPHTLELITSGADLNYLDYIFENSVTDNYELGVTGGNDKTAINFSLGLMNDRGLLRGDKMRRYNVRIGVDHELFKFAKIGANALWTNKNYDRRNTSVFSQALKTGPIGELYNADGTYKIKPDEEFTHSQNNPLLDEVEGAHINNIINNRLFSSGYLQINILKKLTFKSSLGVDLNFEKEGTYQSPYSLGRINTAKPYTEMNNNSSWSYVWDNILNYNINLSRHDLQVMLGSSFSASQNEKYQMNTDTQVTPVTEYYDWNIENALTNSSFSAQQMISFFGRLNYKFNEKYLAQFTYRRDGASQLNKKSNNRWSSFPSASIGWRISEENFLKDLTFISGLKIRASWGKAGNASVQPYESLSYVSNRQVFTAIDGTIYSSYTSVHPENPNLTWEVSTTSDIGIDFSFLNQRISGTFDYYFTKTDNLIFNKPIPSSTGYDYIVENAGISENRGFEIYLNTINIKTKSFEWTTDWNFALNNEKIVRLYDDSEGNPQDNIPVGTDEIWRIGQPLNSYYYWQKEGIYQISDLQKELALIKTYNAGDSIPANLIPMVANGFLPGDVKLKDVNNDGVFDVQDKVIYNQAPKYTFGFTNNFSYDSKIGTIGLSVMVYGRIGQYISYDGYDSYADALQKTENGTYVNSWTPTNTGAEWPRYYSSGNGQLDMYQNAYNYVKGSFVKIKDITLSYSFPKSFLSGKYITNLKIYGTAKNMFTFNEIEDFDTERGGSRNFPLAKQFIVGLNLSF